MRKFGPEVLSYHIMCYGLQMQRRSRTPRPTIPVRERKGDFASLVASTASSSILLPSTHITDGYSFRDIMSNEALTPSLCNVFESSLLYLFYGRPAYRAASEIESNGSQAYWPICFVVDSGCIKPKRIFPFDSGAFHYKRFSRFMYHKMIKEDFELDVSIETPGKIVKLFWKDEKSYFNAKEVSNFTAEALDFEARAYQDLIRDTGRSPFDERNSAIEIQTDEKFELKGQTIAVILPYEFANTNVLSKIESLGAIALPFDVVQRHGATEMVGQIYTIVRDLLGGRHPPGRCKCW